MHMTNQNTDKIKNKLHKGRSILLLASIAVGMLLAGLLGSNSSILLVVGAILTIIGLGVSNLFQANKDLHYKPKTLLLAAYASGFVLGVSLMQINAVFN